MLELSLQTSFKTFCSNGPATIPPQMQPYCLKININGTSLIEIQDNNSIRGSAFENLSE